MNIAWIGNGNNGRADGAASAEGGSSRALADALEEFEKQRPELAQTCHATLDGTMSNSGNYPAWVSEICERVAARLAAIDGIRALALGGSRAPAPQQVRLP